MNSTINNFSIYLLEKKRPFKTYICDDLNVIHTKQIKKAFFRQSGVLEIEAGNVIITQNCLAAPDWLGLINNIITQKDNISLESRKDWSAVLFLRLKGHADTIAITFGRMNGILKDEFQVSDFGLVTSKQLVDSSNVKYVDIQSFDDRQTKVSKQSIKLLNAYQIISPFELNTIKSFKGNTNLSNNKLEIGGRTGLRVKGKIDIQKDLLGLLADVLISYSSRSWTEPKFKILDSINTVTNPKLLNKLSKKLHEKLVGIFAGKLDHNKTRKLSIMPEVDMAIDDFKGFHISGIGIPTTSTDEDLDLLYIFERVKLKLGKTFTESDVIRKLKNMEINCKYFSSENDYSVSFFKSLCFETTVSEVEYIFTGGTWYELNKDFYKRITEKIEQVSMIPALNYIEYDTKIHKTENDYNDSLIQKTNTIGLDCTHYKPSKAIRERSSISPQSNIEIADVLHQNGHTLQFIHVKKKSNASQTNHLFSQAKSSAQLYTNDRVNVQKFINEEIIKQKRIPIKFDRPYKLQVVLAVIIPKSKRSMKNKKHIFTLLERISLYETIEILNSLGFEVVINFIDSNLKNK